MKNNALIVLLVVVISIASAVGLLFGINNAVSVQVAPLTNYAMQFSANQQQLNDKIAALDKKIVELEAQVKSRPSVAAAPAIAQPPAEDLNKVYDIPVGTSPIFGKSEAPITVVEFSDLQCPFCSRFHAPLKEAALAYPDKVKVIIKNYPLPFHPNARPAAKLALAANEQGKYFEMVDQLLNNGAQVEEAKIKEYAAALKLDIKKLMDDFKNKDAQWEAQIAADEQLAQAIDVRGTPTFYLNGKKTNARDASSWKAAFDQELAK